MLKILTRECFTHNPIGYSKTLKPIKCKAEICHKRNKINLSMRVNELLAIFRNSSIDTIIKTFECSTLTIDKIEFSTDKGWIVNFQFLLENSLINQSLPPPAKMFSTQFEFLQWVVVPATVMLEQLTGSSRTQAFSPET